MFHIYCYSACMQNFSKKYWQLPWLLQNLNINPLVGVKGGWVKLWHCHAHLQALGNHAFIGLQEILCDWQPLAEWGKQDIFTALSKENFKVAQKNGDNHIQNVLSIFKMFILGGIGVGRNILWLGQHITIKLYLPPLNPHYTSAN